VSELYCDIRHGDRATHQYANEIYDPMTIFLNMCAVLLSSKELPIVFPMHVQKRTRWGEIKSRATFAIRPDHKFIFSPLALAYLIIFSTAGVAGLWCDFIIF
jgi:hypothetical protein